MSRARRILHVAPEGLPFSKTGGLADVIGGLLPELAAAGLEVAVALPAYRPWIEGAPEPRHTGRHVVGNGGAPSAHRFEVLEAQVGPVRYLLLDQPAFFERAGLYADAAGREFGDNWLRYASFAAAAGELAAQEGFDLVHGHDWQAALVPVYESARQTRPAGTRRFATFLTIHNLAYQGAFPAAVWPALGLPPDWFGPEGLEFYGQVNYLKGGILHAQALGTVSPTYAREILTVEHGAGLEGVLGQRRGALHGILNGVDYAEWDPRTDRHIAERYGPEDLAGKAACKADLQRELGLLRDPRAPLAGIVSRIVEQKGWPVLLGAAAPFVARGMQLAVLGAGEARYEEGVRLLARAFPGSIAVRFGMDPALAHRIEAGADMFLMPSRFEPCGLNQMYSLRYGTVPVVRQTGGLADTVMDASDPAEGTGFVFQDYSAQALGCALDRAVASFGTPAWRALQRRGMLRDFSWRRAAAAYAEVYRSLVPSQTGDGPPGSGSGRDGASAAGERDRPRRGVPRNVLSLALAILTLAVTLTCSDSPRGQGADESAGSGGQAERGGTAVFGIYEEPDGFNEFVKVSDMANQICDHMLFMSLIRYDADLRYTPYLASSWELAENGSSVTFHLRPDVRWGDGTPVRAGDVLFTYRTALVEAVAYPQRAYFRMVRAAEELDSLTVRFDFTGPHAEPLDPFTQWSVMPRHLLEDVPAAGMTSAPFNRAPVGNGPFRLASWKANQSLVFVPNPDFPADLGGPALLDRLVFRVIPEQTTLITELRGGGVDLTRGVPPQEARAIDAAPDLRVVEYDDRSFVYIAWNTRDALFSDPRVRLALSLAIDREQLVEALLYGYGKVAVSYVLPEVAPWAVDPDLEPLPYAPDSARALLAAAGWSDHDGDGVLDRDGRPFRFTVATNKGNDLREDIAVILQSDLRKVGVQAVPQLVEWTVFLGQINDKKFQAYVSSWVYDSFKLDPSDVFHSRAIEGKYNRSSYANPAADSLMDLALATPDRDAARPLWYRFQRIVRDEAPYTFLYYDRERVGVNERLKATEMDARGYLVNAARWWIPSGQRRF
ncbi:MAG: glycogen synthase GlgA [Gemmatimonadetes bacterium]|nr:glycogen synthase GlgA [Gemmatimonadota bacterium]